MFIVSLVVNQLKYIVHLNSYRRLKSEFGTVKDIVQADKGKLSALPGIGEKKAGRIHELFRQPFRNLK